MRLESSVAQTASLNNVDGGQQVRVSHGTRGARSLFLAVRLGGLFENVRFRQIRNDRKKENTLLRNDGCLVEIK